MIIIIKIIVTIIIITIITVIDIILFWIAYNKGYNEATQQAINNLRNLKKDINDIIKINKNDNSIYWEGSPKILYDINKSILVRQHNLIDGTKIMKKIKDIEY